MIWDNSLVFVSNWASSIFGGLEELIRVILVLIENLLGNLLFNLDVLVVAR